MHAVQTCLHLLWLHLIVILFGTASLAQTVKRLCAGFSPLWFETAVHLFPQSQNTCTYTGARDLSCKIHATNTGRHFFHTLGCWRSVENLYVLQSFGPLSPAQTWQTRLRVPASKQTSPQIPFKAGCAIVGHEASGFGTGSLYLLRKREMSVQPFLLEPSHRTESQERCTDNSLHSVFNGGTQRQ